MDFSAFKSDDEDKRGDKYDEGMEVRVKDGEASVLFYVHLYKSNIQSKCWSTSGAQINSGSLHVTFSTASPRRQMERQRHWCKNWNVQKPFSLNTVLCISPLSRRWPLNRSTIAQSNICAKIEYKWNNNNNIFCKMTSINTFQQHHASLLVCVWIPFFTFIMSLFRSCLLNRNIVSL